jgi:uncharacterized DUF497 family protein
VRYEWDENKDIENQRKHGGISFDLASSIFEDPYCLIYPDRVDEMGEQRWHAIGLSATNPDGRAAILLVVHVHKEKSYDEETIRIISARKAGKQNVRRYQEQEMD